MSKESRVNAVLIVLLIAIIVALIIKDPRGLFKQATHELIEVEDSNVEDIMSVTEVNDTTITIDTSKVAPGSLYFFKPIEDMKTDIIIYFDRFGIPAVCYNKCQKYAEYEDSYYKTYNKKYIMCMHDNSVTSIVNIFVDEYEMHAIPLKFSFDSENQIVTINKKDLINGLRSIDK